jgi:hypothetical protein
MKRSMQSIVVWSLLGVLTTGCALPASQQFVSLPVRSHDQAQTLKDNQECDEIAEGNHGPEAQQAVLGAVGGSVAGAGIGAATAPRIEDADARSRWSRAADMLRDQSRESPSSVSE